MRHRTLAAALVGLAVFGAVAGAGDGIGRMMAIRRTSAFLASVPGLEVGRVSVRAGALAIDDLDVRAASDLRLHVGHVVLPLRSTPSSGFAASASAEFAGITLADVSITIRHTVVAIPRIEAEGTDLTADRLRALLDPATGLSVADRLKEITAASLVAPRITISAVRPATAGQAPVAAADDGRAVLEDVALTDILGGRIGSAAIGKTTVFGSASADAATVATLGAITVNGLDLPLAMRIAETARTDPAEPARAIYGSLSIRDIVIAPDETGSLRIGAVEADGFMGRPLLRRPADIVALLDKPGDSRGADDVRTLADLAVDAAKGFSLAHLQWNDVAFAANDNEASRFRIGRIVIDGLSPLRIGTWAVADLGFVSNEASVTLARMALRGPDESELADVMAREFAASGAAMDPSRLMGGVPQDGSVSMLGLHVDVPTPDQPGNSPDGHRTIVDIPVVSFGTETDPATRVATTTAHVQGIYALPQPSDNPGFAALARQGFRRLDARADYRMVLDAKSQEIRLDPLTVAAEKLGRLSVSADVGNVPFDLLARGRPASDAEAAMAKLVFKDASLDFRNDGVVEMALPALAASANTSVPMLKAGAKTQSDLFIGQVMGATPAATRLAAAIDAFIDTPHNLHVAITAPAGLSGAEIEAAPDPKSLLDRVGIEAVANR